MSDTVRHEEFGRDFGLMHEVLITGRKVGADREFWSTLAHNEGLFAFIVRSVKILDSEDNMDLEMFKSVRAFKILGDDFISPQEVASARGLTYSDEQLEHLARTLPSQDILKQLRAEGYLLVAGPPSDMSLLDVRDLNPQLFYSKSGGWYAKRSEKFARRDKVGTAWLALRKGPVPDSTRKTWSEQLELVKYTEQIPNVAEAVWGFTTYAEVRGIRLVPNIYVRTSSVDSGGGRVYVGGFGSTGLYVYYYWSGRRYGNNLGVASVRKF